jgi:hypothetical protein
VVFTASKLLGANVNVVRVLLRVTDPEIVPPGPESTMEPNPTLAGLIGTLVTTSILVFTETPVTPFCGLMDITVGPEVLAPVPVVNDHVIPPDKACPSRSLIPVVALSEYMVFANKGELGTKLAVFASGETVIVPGSTWPLFAWGVSNIVLEVTVIGSIGLLKLS